MLSTVAALTENIMLPTGKIHMNQRISAHYFTIMFNNVEFKRIIWFATMSSKQYVAY